MKTILTISLLALLAISNSTFAQKTDVKIKKNNVYINGMECLRVDQTLTGISFYDSSGDEIVYMQYYDETDVQPAYTKIVFVQQGKVATNQSIALTRKALIRQLHDGKVISGCKLDPTKIDGFIAKYHDEIPVTPQVRVISRQENVVND